MRKLLIYLKTFKKYYYLLTLLVKKDIKKKYKGSILGILWSLLNPLLNMIVITLVFSTLFIGTIENFPVYLLSGVLLFGFFSSSTSSSMKSIISSSSIINKIYVPKYIFPFSKVIADFIFFLISLSILFIIIILMKLEITLSILYAPLYLFLLLGFCFGVSLILSTLVVFFRDIEHIYGVLTTALMYSSALFYPVEIIPEKYQFILNVNPVYYFIEGFRNAIYFGVPLDEVNLMHCTLISLLSITIGLLMFKKYQDKFILYI